MSDYLVHLQQRTKWYIDKDNLKAGCIVILKKDILPPRTWALGRVIKVVHGADKNVKVLEIERATGIVTLSMSKVWPFNI